MAIRSDRTCKPFGEGTLSALRRSHSRGCPATVQPRPRLRFLVSIWRQSAPTVPVWPVMPSHKPFVFNYSGDLRFHGMEEVTGYLDQLEERGLWSTVARLKLNWRSQDESLTERFAWRFQPGEPGVPSGDKTAHAWPRKMRRFSQVRISRAPSAWMRSSNAHSPGDHLVAALRHTCW
jgi:hypothetical protein